jgi:hypothetical protein
MTMTMEELRRRGITTTMDEAVALFERVLRDLPETGPASASPTELAEWEIAELAAGGVDLAPLRPDDVDPRARTAARFAALLSQSLTLQQASERLGVHPSRLRQRLAARTLYGIKVEDEWRVPAFQFDGDRLLPNLGPVMRRLPPDAHPLGIATWFMTPDPDLELDDGPASPRDWLRSGGDPAAIASPDLQL